MKLFQKILGLPFVYNHIRPFVVGGIDLSPLYQILGAKEDDIILDIGCGTGVALDYLKKYRAYFGFDTDPVAIAYSKKYETDHTHFECRLVTEDDILKIKPTLVIMSGLLHHLSDNQAISLLKMCGPKVRRIATQDVIYLPGHLINNLFAWLDRGKHVRHQEGYHQLIEKSGLKIVQEEICRSHPKHGRVNYFLMGIES